MKLAITLSCLLGSAVAVPVDLHRALSLPKADVEAPVNWFNHSMVASWTLKDPAVPSLIPAIPNTTSPALVLTTFGVLGNEPMWVIPDVGGPRGGGNDARVLLQNFNWCNMVFAIPENVFNVTGLLLAAGGFLVPGKSTGTVSVVNVSAALLEQDDAVFNLAPTDSGFFYHKAVFYDIDGDGKLDVLAARAKVPSFPGQPKQGELVWFKHPATEPFSTQWEAHVLTTGPDVSFALLTVEGVKLPAVVATQFFTSPALVLYTCDKDLWSLCQPSDIKATVIDSTNGPFFDVQIVDLNKDGREDLLVTNNRADGKGSVFAYETPNQRTNSNEWTMHLLATGYTPLPTRFPTPGRGAPGKAEAIWPRVKDSNTTKPSILVSGDDAGTVSVLWPASEDSSDWQYVEERWLNSTGTVGGVEVGDIDSDGFLDVFVPEYGAGFLHLYHFS